MNRYLIFAALAILTALIAACSGSEPAQSQTSATATVQSPQATVASAPLRATEQAPDATTAPILPGNSSSNSGVSPIATTVPAPELDPTPTPTFPAMVPTPTAAPDVAVGVSLQVRADWGELTDLFSGKGVNLQPELQKVSILSLDGSEIESQGGTDSYSFVLPPGAAYLVKARSVNGVIVWALTPQLTGDSTQIVSLRSTYEAGLIYAAEGQHAVTTDAAAALMELAGRALDVGADRLVNTIKRVVDNALLWGNDYSVFTEFSQTNLRAFGGGLQPIRSLDSLINSPSPDYVPHVYMLNVSAQDVLFLDRIFMSELKADRWTVILAAQDIPPRVHGGLGGMHVVHGGSTIVYGEDKCFKMAEGRCQSFNQVIVTKPLDSPPDSPAIQLTSVEDFDGAHRPRWSWDEGKIPFHAFPNGRLAPAQIYSINKDGSGKERITNHTQGQNGARHPSWSPDNSNIAFMSDEESSSWDIWVMDADGNGKQNLTGGRVKFPNEPEFSPDGRRILFYGHDTKPNSSGRGAPDYELWLMGRDGSNLRMVTSNDSDDENPVWALNGLDVVYTVDDENWASANVFTGQRLFEFPGVSHGKYQSPVLAATEHVLVPSQAAIDAEVVDVNGYVEKDWLATRLAERIDTGGEVVTQSTNKTGGYQVVTPSADPLSGIRYEIFTAFTQTPIYTADVGGWTPSIISWGLAEFGNPRPYRATRATTRAGEPEPPSIFRGKAITTAPASGSWSRFARLVRPMRPAPCMMLWLGKGGSKVPAMPASVPTVSTPTPNTSRCWVIKSAASLEIPGTWELPSSPMFL